ncbi:hypothetical protein AB0M10_33980 [Streptomyces sp. NPDC051840]|uniref:hypothetical protein n=1 Tax=Streptomyces sp. NPDC051840 TaxID=3154752 RepID=UPI00343EB715
MGIEDLLVQELREQSGRAPRTGRRSAWAYGSLAELLLERGRLFTPAELPATVRRLPAQQCYANAFALASYREGLVYAEGYAVCEIGGDLLHFQHAWCVAADGVVVDPTWESPGEAYLGLALGPAVGVPGLGPGLIHEPQMLGSVLREGLPDGALVEGLGWAFQESLS